MGDTLYNAIVLIPGRETDNRAIWGFTVFVQELAPTIKVKDIVEMGSCVGPVVEVRLFMKNQQAHVRFTQIEHAIKFMELFNKHPFKTGRRNLVYRPLMAPSSDYPCLTVRGLPQNMTDEILFNAIQQHTPQFELVRVLRIFENRAVVQFASQRVANNMIKFSTRVPLVLDGMAVGFEWEGTPVARVNGIRRGFADKEKIFQAFDVVEGNHVLAVALLVDRAYVYFDYRFNLEAAVAVIGKTLIITMDDGTMRTFPYLLL